MEISYTINQDHLKKIIGLKLSQIIVKKGEVSIGASPQIRSAEEVIFIFHSNNKETYTLKLQFRDFLFRLSESKELFSSFSQSEKAVSREDYSLWITSPNREEIKNIELVYELIKNYQDKDLCYINALVFNFTDNKRLLFYLDESPYSFVVTYDNPLMHQYLVEDSYQVEILRP